MKIGGATMKVNYRQISILIFLSFISLKLLALPSLMYAESGTTGLIGTIVLMMIDFIYAIMLVDILKKCKYKSLVELLDNLFGKVISRLILICFALRFAVNLALLTNGLEFFIIENLYTNLNWLVYILPMLAIVGFMMYKGIRNIGRVSELEYVIIVTGCIYITLKSISAVTPYFILPFFENGIRPVLNAGYSHICWFGSATFIIVLVGKVDFQQEKKKKLEFMLFFSIILVSFMHFVFYCLFDKTSALHGFAISAIGQYNTNATLTGELAWLVMSLWIITQIVQIALYGYCIVECLTMVFGGKAKYAWVMFVNLFLLVWCYLNEKTIHLENVFFSNYLIIPVFIVQYILPIIIFVFELIRRHKVVKNEKVKAHI